MVEHEQEHKSNYLIAAISADNQQEPEVDETIKVSKSSEMKISNLQMNLKEIEDLIKNLDKQDSLLQEANKDKNDKKKRNLGPRADTFD